MRTKPILGYRMSPFIPILAVSAILVSVATQAQTTTISLNWKEFAGGVNDVLDGYGVVPADNWANLLKDLDETDLVASGGSVTTVDLSGIAAGGYSTFGWAAQNNTPMRAGLATFGPTVLITLSDLEATFVSYDVVVYAAGFNQADGGNQGAISLATPTGASPIKYFSVPNPFTTSLIESTDIDISDGADPGTYVRFDGLSGDSLTITLDSINGGVGIGGLQISGLAVPEPASAMTLLLGGGALAVLLRRRPAA